MSNILSTIRSGIIGREQALDKIKIHTQNIANTRNEPYHHRYILNNSSIIRRKEDYNLLNSVSIAKAEVVHTACIVDHCEEIRQRMSSLKSPDNPHNLVTNIQGALQILQADPGNQVNRANVIHSLNDLALTVNNLNNDIQKVRTNAEQQIQEAVDEINLHSKEIADLNKQIKLLAVIGQKDPNLEDRRDELLTNIRTLIPCTMRKDSNNMISVLMSNGLPIVNEVTNYAIEHQHIEQVTRAMSIGAQLDGVSIGGHDITTYVNMGNSKISALFKIRDDTMTNLADELNNFRTDFSEALNTAQTDAMPYPALSSYKSAISVPLDIECSGSIDIHTVNAQGEITATQNFDINGLYTRAALVAALGDNIVLEADGKISLIGENGDNIVINGDAEIGGEPFLEYLGINNLLGDDMGNMVVLQSAEELRTSQISNDAIHIGDNTAILNLINAIKDGGFEGSIQDFSSKFFHNHNVQRAQKEQSNNQLHAIEERYAAFIGINSDKEVQEIMAQSELTEYCNWTISNSRALLQQFLRLLDS